MINKSESFFKLALEQVLNFINEHNTAAAVTMFDQNAELVFSVLTGNGLSVLSQFIETFPPSNQSLYNHICCCSINEAQQYAEVYCVDAAHDFHFVLMICNHWICNADHWSIDEMRLDVQPLTTVPNTLSWNFENPIALPGANVRIPSIFAELDAPWVRIPNPVTATVTIEEQITDLLNQFAFGLNHIMFRYVDSSLANTFPDRRIFFSKLKFHRQKYRHFCHPYQIHKIEFFEKTAVATVSLLFDTGKTYSVFFRQEAGMWKIADICRKEEATYAKSRL